MLLILPQVEMKLSETRDYMDLLDQTAFEQFGEQPVCRVALEDKLEYLRLYACRWGNEVDQFKSITLVGHDSFPCCFSFEVRTDLQGSTVSGPIDWRSIYPKHVISGGLIWSGPKTIEDYINAANRNLRTDFWGMHT